MTDMGNFEPPTGPPAGAPTPPTHPTADTYLPPGPAPQGPYGAPVGHAPYGYAPVYPETSQALVAVLLAAAGLFVCQILAPVGWYLGQQELTAIDAGMRDPSNRSMAMAAKIIGIIGTVIIVAIIALFGFFIIFAGAASVA